MSQAPTDTDGSRLAWAADDDASPRRSLILSGGGMRVGYQAGVVRALLESGLRFTHGDGTSGGSMNLAMLMSGQSAAEMCERWSTLKARRFISLLPVPRYLRPLRLPALGSATGIRRSVFPHLGIDLPAIRAATGAVGTFNVCNFNRKTNEVVTNDELDVELLVAGMSLPLAMPPVRRGDTLYVDSAWIKDANLMEAVRRGADELWVVWVIGNPDEYRGGFFNQYVHMLELSANGGLFVELEQITELNSRITAGETVLGRTTPVRLHLIKPEVALPLDPDLLLGRISPAALVAIGYADGVRYLRGLRADGLAFEPEVTKASPQRYVRFEETMSGHFALDEVDPLLGARSGKDRRTRLTLRCSVAIADGGDRADVAGSIDFPPLGKRLLAQTGEAVIRSDAGGRRRLHYALTFTDDEGDLHLVVDKKLTGGLRLWSGARTAHVRLHRGADEIGPVIGAGVLRLRVRAILRLLWTARATGAKRRGRPLAAVARLYRGRVRTR